MTYQLALSRHRILSLGFGVGEGLVTNLGGRATRPRPVNDHADGADT